MMPFGTFVSLLILMTKQAVLIIAVGIISAGFWFTLKPLFESQDVLQNWFVWFWPFVLGILFLATLCLSFVLLTRSWRLLAIGLNLLIFLIFFGWSYILIGGAALSLLFQLAAANNIAGEKVNHLKFSLRSIIRPGMARLVTAVLILVSFGYFLSGGVQASAETKKLPEGVQRTIQIIVGNYLGETSSGVDNPNLRARTSREIISQLNQFLKPYFKFLPPVLAFGLFLILQGLSVIFIWLSIFLAFIIFAIMKTTGWVKIEKGSKEAETVIF